MLCLWFKMLFNYMVTQKTGPSAAASQESDV